MIESNDSADRWISPAWRNSTGARRVADALTLGTQLRTKVAKGWALGTFVIELPSLAVFDCLAVAGFDFVVLDMEHSGIGFSALQNLITAAHRCGLPALVRPWGDEPGVIGKVLDMGANGIMAAHVSNADFARRVVEQARFKPQGSRGFSPLTRFDGLECPLKALNESIYVVVQIEGTNALKEVGDIASVPGIDAVFVGPYDLALSMGAAPGSAAVFEAASGVSREVPSGVGLGIYIDDPLHCADWVSRRFALQCVSFDSRMLANGARLVVDTARSMMADSGDR